jgi:hypothetical protein
VFPKVCTEVFTDVFYFAKVLQAVGFADVGYGLFLGLTQEGGMTAELIFMGIGVIVFYLGRYLEGRAATT